MFRLLLLVLVVLLNGCASSSDSQHQHYRQNNNGFDRWISEELLPYMTQTFGSHPKFSAAPVLLVAMDNEQISNDIDTLTYEVRETLMDGLLNHPGIKVVRRQQDYQNRHHRSLGTLSCDVNLDARYYIGLSIHKSSMTGDYVFRVRAAEVENPDSWVAGFNKTWRGSLNPTQINALQSKKPDNYLKGLRNQPFNGDESDLTAQYLAHNLSCVLAQSGLSTVKVHVEKSRLSQKLDALIDMTTNYISRFNEVSLTANKAGADATLNFDLYHINQRNNLKQLNAGVQYRNGNKVKGTDTQVYLNFSPEITSAKINLWSFIAPKDQAQCYEQNPWQKGEYTTTHLRIGSNGCFALRYETTGKVDHVIYHSPQGQYAVLDSKCLTISRQKQFTRLPAKSSHTKAIYLTGAKGAEQFYLLSSPQPLADSTLARWLKKLPSLCEGQTTSSHSVHLTQMLSEYMAVNPGLDWRILTVNHI